MLNGYYSWQVLAMILLFVTALQAHSETDEPAKSVEKVERKLSRKRRYLIFPVGSSIQLVYDSTITVPGYTLYVTTGVTCALSWGLPDSPVYPETDLMEQYDSGKLPLLLREDKNVTDSNRKGEIKSSTAPVNAINTVPKPSYSNSNGNDVINRIANYYKYFQRRKPDSYYFGNSPLYSTNYNKESYCNNGNCAYYTNVKGNGQSSAHISYHDVRPPYSATYDRGNQYDAFAKYMNETIFKSWMASTLNAAKSTTLPPATAKPTSKTKATTKTDFKPIINKLHSVYVAMGKRSVRDTSLTFEQKFYLDHHRSTRHKLYEIVEKYLFAKGYNGTECVLKTLCEVGQKRHENEPGSLLAEIVRAVFSLPVAQLQRVIHKRHIEYDAAHQTVGTCATAFPLCPHSIWNAGFLVESDETLDNQNQFRKFQIKKQIK